MFILKFIFSLDETSGIYSYFKNSKNSYFIKYSGGYRKNTISFAKTGGGPYCFESEILKKI